MAKKRGKVQPRPKKTESVHLTLSDALGDDVLAKLKAAKNDLTNAEREKEEERREILLREKKEREKNKSFEELLEEYGDIGSKF
jgi:hypothetical protein